MRQHRQQRLRAVELKKRADAAKGDRGRGPITGFGVRVRVGWR